MAAHFGRHDDAIVNDTRRKSSTAARDCHGIARIRRNRHARRIDGRCGRRGGQSLVPIVEWSPVGAMHVEGDRPSTDRREILVGRHEPLALNRPFPPDQQVRMFVVKPVLDAAVGRRHFDDVGLRVGRFADHRHGRRRAAVRFAQSSVIRIVATMDPGVDDRVAVVFLRPPLSSILSVRPVQFSERLVAPIVVTGDQNCLGSSDFVLFERPSLGDEARVGRAHADRCFVL